MVSPIQHKRSIFSPTLQYNSFQTSSSFRNKHEAKNSSLNQIYPISPHKICQKVADEQLHFIDVSYG
ncbi:hypothetical protein T06_4006 [Trichinella sp. T6]|nr:hypothetical protein T06_4006 [Trichinella sp. T6]